MTETETLGWNNVYKQDSTFKSKIIMSACFSFQRKVKDSNFQPGAIACWIITLFLNHPPWSFRSSELCSLW